MKIFAWFTYKFPTNDVLQFYTFIYIIVYIIYVYVHIAYYYNSLFEITKQNFLFIIFSRETTWERE